jgi:transposase
MIGRKEIAPKMFHSVTLESLVPKDHELRKIDKLIDFTFIRELVEDKYSWTGQPSVDPVVIIKMLFIGYFYGVLSERKLSKQIQTDLAYRLFLGYDLDEKIPNHSVLSKARKRYGVNVFKSVFDRVVELCVEAGLVEGKQAFMDATMIKANASLDSIVPRLEILNANEYTEKMMGKESEQKPVRKDGSGFNRKKVSKTDPEATFQKGSGGHTKGLYYKGHYLIDKKKRVIVAAGASDTREHADFYVPEYIKKTLFRHKLKFSRFCADSEYGHQLTYEFLLSNGITPYIPLRSIGDNKGFFTKEDFYYDKDNDCYWCPAKQKLIKRRFDKTKQVYLYGPEKRGICKECKLRSLCTDSKDDRRVRHLIYQSAINRAKEINETKLYRRLMSQRKHLIESLFGEAKEFHGLRRARFRGIKNVEFQVVWTATIQNIKRLLNFSSRKPGHAVAVEKRPISALFDFIFSYLLNIKIKVNPACTY